MRYLIEALQKNGNWEPAGNPTSDAIVETKKIAESLVRTLALEWECPKSDLRIVRIVNPDALIAELESLGFRGNTAEEFAEYFK